MDIERRFLLFLLSHAPEAGASTILRLAERADLEMLLHMSEEERRVLGELTESQSHGISAVLKCLEGIRREFERLERSDIRYISYYDEAYPEKLRNIHNPPATLFVKGSLPDPDLPSVAIVGARAATNYGISMSEYLSNALAEQGIQIISGLALGIDAAAHRGALSVDHGMTFGILAGGVNICYPKENFDIYDAMIHRGKCGVISETLPGTGNLRQLFPMRNRIISGLSDVIVIVEAREKSGSLITAELALSQGKDVMAVPGRLTDPLSRGCNRLISEGAAVITGPDDILEVLGLMRNRKLEIPDKNITLLAKEEKLVYSTMDSEPKYAQTIVEETGLPYARVCSILLDLELKGYIIQMSGNYYGIK